MLVQENNLSDSQAQLYEKTEEISASPGIKEDSRSCYFTYPYGSKYSKTIFSYDPIKNTSLKITREWIDMWRYQTVHVGPDIYGLKNYSSPVDFVKYSSLASGKVTKTKFDWVQDPPTPRTGASLINYLDQYIILSGGANPANSVQKLASVELYTIEKNCWVSIPALNQPR